MNLVSAAALMGSSLCRTCAAVAPNAAGLVVMVGVMLATMRGGHKPSKHDD